MRQPNRISNILSLLQALLTLLSIILYGVSAQAQDYRYNDTRAGEHNSNELLKYVEQIESEYEDGGHRQHAAVIEFKGGYLRLEYPIPLPEIVISGRRTIIPTLIKGNNTLIVCTSPYPTITFTREGFPGTAINSLTSDLAPLIVKDLLIRSSSNTAGVHIHHAGKDFSFENVMVTATVADGFHINDCAGGKLSNCYAFRCGRHGFRIENVFEASFIECTSRANTSQGLKLDNATSISGGFYLEANYGYGSLLKRLSSSNLKIYHEFNRRADSNDQHSGLQVRQGKMIDCRNNIITGRDGNDIGRGYTLDPISMRGNTFSGDPMRKLVDGLDPTLRNVNMVTRNFFSGAYTEEKYEPRVIKKGSYFEITIPAGCFDNWNGLSGKNYWTPTNRGQLTEGLFSDNDTIALVIDTEIDEATLDHCDRTGDYGILPHVESRIAYVNLNDGTRGDTQSGTLHFNRLKQRDVYAGAFDNAGNLSFFNIVFNASHGAGPKEDLVLKMSLNLYKVTR